jgi:hypothetical protein
MLNIFIYLMYTFLYVQCILVNWKKIVLPIHFEWTTFLDYCRVRKHDSYFFLWKIIRINNSSFSVHLVHENVSEQIMAICWFVVHLYVSPPLLHRFKSVVHFRCCRSRDTSVAIATGYRQNDHGLIPDGQEVFLYSAVPSLVPGAHPSSC